MTTRLLKNSLQLHIDNFNFNIVTKKLVLYNIENIYNYKEYDFINSSADYHISFFDSNNKKILSIITTNSNIDINKVVTFDFSDTVLIDLKLSQGYFMKFDILNPRNTISGLKKKFSELDDVDVSVNLLNGDINRYNTTTEKFENKILNLNQLDDVGITNPTVEQILLFNAVSQKFENGVIPSMELSALFDVNFSFPLLDNQIIRYNSGTDKWNNVVLPTPTTATVSSSDNKITVTQIANDYQLTFEAQNCALSVFPGDLPINRITNLQSTLDTKIEADSVEVLTNKTINSDVNTIINIVNADIKNGAAINSTKIADGSVSNDQFQYINSITSNVQDQLNTKLEQADIDNKLSQGGDAYGAPLVLGTTDNNLISIISNNIEKFRISSNGLSGIGELNINGLSGGFGIAGSNLNIISAGANSAPGGNLNLRTGSSGGGGSTSGQVIIGSGDSQFASGSISLISGASLVSTTGSAVFSTGFPSNINGTSGSSVFSTGNGGSASGNISIFTGALNSSSNVATNSNTKVGNILIQTGEAFSSGANAREGGSVTLKSSDGINGGANGIVNIFNGSNNGLIVESDGTLITNTNAYESLVTGVNDITNKKYVDDSIENRTIFTTDNSIISTPSNNQFLRYNGSNWINETINITGLQTWNYNSNVNLSNNDYLLPSGVTQNNFYRFFICGSNGTISNFRVLLSNAASIGGSFSFQIMIGDTNISSFSFNVSNSSVNNATPNLAVSAGNLISVRVINNTNINTSACIASLQITS